MNWFEEMAFKVLPVESLIRQVAKILTNADDEIIDKVFEEVQKLDKENLPGYEKRKAVYEQLKKDAINLANWSINLLIELAVAYYKYKYKAQQKSN